MIVYIGSGSPWQNGHIESYHDKQRDECMNRGLLGACVRLGSFWRLGMLNITNGARIALGAIKPPVSSLAVAILCSSRPPSFLRRALQSTKKPTITKP